MTRTPSAGTTLAATLAIQALVSMAALTLPVLAPLIAPPLGRPASMLAGLFAALVFLGAMASSLVAGALVARVGAIRASQFGLALCASGLACASLPWLPAMVGGALLIGLGYGPITPASSHLLIRTTPAHRLSLMFSIKQTGVPVGGLMAGALAPGLALLAGWQAAVLAVALACLLVAALAQPLRAAFDGDRDPGARLRAAHLLRPVRLVLSQGILTRLALCSFLFAIAQVALTAFLVIHLHEGLGVDLVAAGLLLSIAQGAGVIGRIAWGWVADAGLGPRRTLTLLAALMAASALATAALPVGAPMAVTVAVLLAFGASAVGWNGVYLAEVARRSPAGLAGVATGGVLVFTFFGNVVGPLLFGALAGLAGGFQVAYALLSLPLAAAGLLLHRMRT
ncbi:MFS transporter (plasmid) [Comamonadaceae bacterium OTU4NAUVB1]|nr:MFS transporter [Comamonadaceae bacterium OTU4NAUVB1]